MDTPIVSRRYDGPVTQDEYREMSERLWIWCNLILPRWSDVGPDRPYGRIRPSSGRRSNQPEFILYRLIDSDGRVLYIGITRNLPARIQAHRKKFGSTFADVLVEGYDDAVSLLEAERAAIRDEQPPFNIDGVG